MKVEDEDKLFKAPTADGALISKMIGWIEVRGKKLTEYIQITATSVVLHAVKHADVAPANQLAEKLRASLPASMKVKTLEFWLVDHGPFSLKDGKLVFNAKRNEALKVTQREDVEGFTQNRIDAKIWATKPKPAEKPFVIEEELAKVFKRAKAAESSKVEGTKTDGYKEFQKLHAVSFKEGQFKPKVFQGVFWWIALPPARQAELRPAPAADGAVGAQA